jgi:hypothetical protein
MHILSIYAKKKTIIIIPYLSKKLAKQKPPRRLALEGKRKQSFSS